MAHSVQNDEERRVHKIGVNRYYIVWIALLVLTAITVFSARFELGHGLDLGVAMVIATVKASLVALFFMHLWDHGGANRLVLVTGLFFLALLMGIVLMDNASRFPLSNPPTAETMRWQPPGPDILSPQANPPVNPRGGEHQGPRDQAPQEKR